MKNINDIKVSDLKAAINDPKALEAIRKMSPDLAKMSDEDFEKIVIGAAGRVDQFMDKFGDLNGAQMQHLNDKK